MIIRIIDGQPHVIADISEQADWSQEDKREKSYIKNKPDLEAIVNSIETIKGMMLNKTDADFNEIFDFVEKIKAHKDKLVELEVLNEFMSLFTKHEIKFDIGPHEADTEDLPKNIVTYNNIHVLPKIAPKKEYHQFLGYGETGYVTIKPNDFLLLEKEEYNFSLFFKKLSHISAHSEPMNLGIDLFGREVESPEEVKAILNAVRQTIVDGNISNLVLGDYINFPISATNKFEILSGSNSMGINLSNNPKMPGSEKRYLGIQITSKNGFKNEDNDFDHVCFDLINPICNYYLDMGQKAYSGSEGQTFIRDHIMLALQGQGIPFNEYWIPALKRRVSKRNTTQNEFDLIEDQLFLPTEYEIRGEQSEPINSENNQGRLEYYTSNISRVKRDQLGDFKSYWLATPTSTNSFYMVTDSGTISSSLASSSRGFSPVFCVGANSII